jgi:hypothetical protein
VNYIIQGAANKVASTLMKWGEKQLKELDIIVALKIVFDITLRDNLFCTHEALFTLLW